MYKKQPALRDYLMNYKNIVHDQHATTEDCFSTSFRHCTLCGNHGMVKQRLSLHSNMKNQA